jgi:GNAT superfamily N-acetyltransferase
MSAEQAIQIIEATADADVRVVAQLYDEYRAFYGPTPGVESTYLFLREHSIADEIVLFTAFDAQDSPVGFMQLYPSFYRMVRFWLLNDLYVRPAFRRRGLARLLVKRAEQYARQTGAAGLTLCTAIDNHAAQELYESEGFERDRDVVHYSRFF